MRVASWRRRASVARLSCALMMTCCCGRAAEHERIEAAYDKTTGRLGRLSYDANNNGKPDHWSYLDGEKLIRTEVDGDENGVIERWEYYTEDRRLEKVGVSRANDGKMDSWVYPASNGGIARIEISTKRDGKINRVEFYENDELVRSEEDTDGNAAVDKWETFSDGVLTSVAFDTVGAGRPTRRLVYAKDGSVERIESPPAVDRSTLQP